MVLFERAEGPVVTPRMFLLTFALIAAFLRILPPALTLKVQKTSVSASHSKLRVDSCIPHAKTPESVLSGLRHQIENGKGSLKSVNEALWQANKWGNWRLAKDVYAMAKLTAKEGTIRPLSPGVYSRALLTLVKCGGSGVDALQLVCESLEHGHILSDAVYTGVLLELGKRGEIPAMLAILDQLSRYDGVSVSNSGMMALLVACDCSKQYDRMLELYYSRMKPRMLDWVAVGLLLKACAHVRRADAAVEIIEAVFDAYVLDDEFLTSMPESIAERAIAILVTQGEGEMAVRLALQMELMRAEPDVVEGEEEVEQQQRQFGSLTDSEYLSIIQRLLDASKSNESGPEGAEQDGLVVSLESLDVVERATLHLLEGEMDAEDHVERMYMESGDVEEKEEEEGGMGDVQDAPRPPYESITVIDALLDMTHPPACSPRVYCGVVSALARCGRAHDCRQVLQSYKARGGKPLEEMYTSTLAAFRYSRDVASAREVFEELKGDSRVRATIASYNALLLVHAVSGLLPGEKQGQLLAEIEQAGLALTRESYTALIMGQASSEARMALWEEMIGTNITPTIASVQEVLKVADGDMALRVLDYLWRLPPVVRPVATREEARRDWSQHRERKSAGPIQWKQAKARGGFHIRPRHRIEDLAPTVNTVRFAIQALAAEGRSQEIMEVIARMRESGVEPNFKCYMAALAAFDANSDDWQSAVKLLIQMQGKGMRSGLTRALKEAIRTCFNGQRYDLIKKLVDSARINPRFLSNTPLEVQEVALVAAFKMHDEDWAARLASASTGEQDIVEVRRERLQAVREEKEEFKAFAKRAGFAVDLVEN